MLHAFIDESGQRSNSAKSSPHFVLGGVVFRDKNIDNAKLLLSELRAELNRKPEHELHWNQIKTHAQRLYICQRFGKFAPIKHLSVVACKRSLPRGQLDDDQVYLYQLRYLLERLSWLARKHGEVATYTIAHIKNFKKEKLEEYESKLRTSATRIEWDNLDPKGGKIDQPKRQEFLQLADLSVSAIAAGFNPDEFGNTERRYVAEIRHQIYRHSDSAPITSYGLKIHPWNNETQLNYSWLKNL